MKLTIDSICLISSILDKIEIEDKFMDEMIAIGRTAQNKNKIEQENIKSKIGIKIALKIGTKLHLVRDDLIKFTAVYKDISEEEAKNIDFVEIVKELIKDKEFISFLKQKAMSK